MKKKLFVLSCLLLILVGGCSNRFSNSVFPDPCLFSQGHNQIFFTDLPASCTIEITTLTGDLVRTIVESDGDGEASWDVKNQAGEEMGSGIYLYLIKSPGEVKKGKLVITK